MADYLERRLARWVGSGVIDADTAGRIRAFEDSRSGGQGLRWPVLLAPHGPPRPIRLAVKKDGALRPLDLR